MDLSEGLSGHHSTLGQETNDQTLLEALSTLFHTILGNLAEEKSMKTKKKS